MMLEIALAGVAVPLGGWTLNKIVQHDRDIAVLKQVATDIRDSLQHLERLLEVNVSAKGQTRRYPR